MNLVKPIHQRSSELYWNAVRLRNGLFAVGTASGKALVIDPDGLKIKAEIKSSYLSPQRNANVTVALGDPGEFLVFFDLYDPFYRAFQVHHEESFAELRLHEYSDLTNALYVEGGVAFGADCFHAGEEV